MRPLWQRGLMAGLCVLSVTTATGWWVSPPATAQDDDGRKVRERPRREGLRRLGGLALDRVGELLQGNAATLPLDVEQINATAQSWSQRILVARGSVSRLEFELDPSATDLAEDRLQLNIRVGLAKTLWSAEPSDLRITLRLALEREPEPRLLVTVSCVLETDVPALAGQALPLLARRLAADTSGTQAEQDLRTQIAARLSTARPREVDDLADLLLSISALRLNSLGERIAQLTSDSPTSAADPESLATELRVARQARDALVAAETRLERDDDGRLVHLGIVAQQVDLAFGQILEQATIAVEENRLEVHLQDEIEQGGTWYALFKPLVVGRLVKFQEGDPAALEGAEQLFGRALELLVPSELPE